MELWMGRVTINSLLAPFQAIQGRRMKFLSQALFVLLLVFVPGRLAAQGNHAVRGADERFKVDILVVVAHPDDEAFFTPYLVRAINDLHKRVAVIFSTRGGSGANHDARERGPSLANEREIEAREACARLGISKVWFLDGQDTATQDLLDSLANWGHGENLERLVGLIRLTRPEVVFTHFPGIFIGENHGDHQATGVLVTEAFDLSANPICRICRPGSRKRSITAAMRTTSSNLLAPDRPIRFARYHLHGRNPTGAWRWIPDWPTGRNSPMISSAFPR